MDIKEMSINTRNWIDSVHDRDYWRVLVNRFSEDRCEDVTRFLLLHFDGHISE